ncbi:hypothetical protein ACHWQZ_G017890 [Mnemiopsis leidyi]
MDELPGLLHSRQPNKVRQGAAELILGLTSDAASLRLITSNDELVHMIWETLDDKDKKLSVAASQILVNMTSHSDQLFTAPKKTVPQILWILHNTDAIHMYNSMAMVLNNISRSLEQAKIIVEMLSLKDCQLFLKLISCNQEQGYLAAVLGNIAVTDEGRKLLLQESLFSELISLLTMPGNIIVRRNIARLLRNLSFDTKTHNIFLQFLPQIVYPLVGGEEVEDEDMEKLPLDLQYLPEDKCRESDLQTRILLSDTLFQIGGSFSVREKFREENYYVLLKNYDQWEEDMDARERIQNVIYLIVQEDGEVDLRKEGELPQGLEKEDQVVHVERDNQNVEILKENGGS